MIQIDVLLDGLRLLLHVNSDTTRQLVTKTIETYNAAMQNAANMPDLITQPEHAEFYIYLISLIMRDDVTVEQPVKIAKILTAAAGHQICLKHPEVYNAIKVILTNTDPISTEEMDELMASLESVQLEAYLQKRQKEINSALYRAQAMRGSNRDRMKALSSVVALHSGMTDAVQNTLQLRKRGRPAMQTVDFDNPEHLAAALTQFNERVAGGRIVTGLQGLNRSLGGGFIRGESVIFAAFSHNYKSGMLMHIAAWILLYNQITTTDGRIPCVIFESLENEAWQNTIAMFESQYKITTGNSPKHLTEMQIVEWIKHHFARNGIKLVIRRDIPENFGAEELFEVVESYEDAGYEVVAVVLDYMAKMRLGDKGTNHPVSTHQGLTDLSCKLFNYHKHKGICFFTGHQLTKEVAREAAQGTTNLVKKFGAGHIADAVGVFREADTVFFMHLEFNGERQRFLTVKLDKRRYVHDTPDVDKYFAYPFVTTPSGLVVGIVDDVENAVPGFTRNIYTWTNGPSETAHYDDLGY